MGRIVSDEGIVCRVVGMPETYPAVSVAKARAVCIGLSKEHPARWVVAHWPDGKIVHRLEPTAFVDESIEEPVDLLALLPDQSSLF